MMNSYPSSQKLYPISWFSELTNRQYKGCLRVASGTTSWSLYLESGKLIYASNSIDPLERLDRHLSRHLSSVYSAIRDQWRSQFTTPNFPVPHPDYQVICWLVQQNHLHRDQAARIVQDIAQEVLPSLLGSREGNYSLNEFDTLDNFPKFCYLDLMALAQSCQEPMAPPNLQTPSSGSVPTSQPPHTVSRLSVSTPSNTANLLSRESTPQSTLPSPQTPSRVYTIACIDDNPSIVRVIRSYLDDEKFSVLTIDDPVKALMQIVRNKPDLILLDVEMPKLDGYELCSMLRRHPLFKNIPIIMVTGNTGFIDRAKAKLVRSSDYLTKPFTKSALNEMVLKHLP
jgi:two-component system, chemotaxis family, response regulator PixG